MKLRIFARETVPFIEIFIASLIILVVIAINRGIIQEQKLKGMEYPPGFTAIGISIDQLQNDGWGSKEINSQIVDINIKSGGVLTNYMDYYNEMSITAAEDPVGNGLPENLKNVQLISTGSGYFDFFKPKLRSGRYFTSAEEDKGVCVIGEGLAKRLFGSVQESIDKTIELPYMSYKDSATRWMKVVGVLMGSERLPARTIEMFSEPYQTVNIYSDDIIILPINIIEGSSLEVSNTIWIDKDVNEGNKLALELSKSYTDFKYTVNPELVTVLKNPLSEMVALYVLNAFVVLIFIVAGMGMMGIQLISIGRRRKEIGLNMAFGATRKNIILMILKETMARFIAPSIAGVLAGLCSLKYVSRILKIPIHMDLNTVLIFVFVTVLFATCVGLYPALKAASLDPVNAMGRAPGLS